MKSLELKRQKEGLMAERNILANKAELTDAEKTRWDETQDLVKNLDKEIERQEQIENQQRLAAGTGKDVSKQEEKDIQKYSLLKAIREMAEGKRLTGIEKEMHDEAAKENGTWGGVMGLGISQKVLANKTVTRSTLAAASSPVVPTVIGNFIDAVWAKTVLVPLGAQTLSGLTGNVDLPYFSTKPTVKWDAENDAASDAAAALNKVSLTPKRITNYVPLSKLLLVQEAAGIEEKVWNALISAAAVHLQRGALHGASDGPTGLIATSGIGDVVGGTNGAAPTLPHVLELISKIELADADMGSLAFVTSPKIKYKLMVTAIESGHPERVWNILEPTKLVGYNAAVTTLVSDTLTKGNQSLSSAIFFGNWNKFILAQFGAVDLLVDPYTSAKSNIVDLIMNAFYDAAPEHPASFACMKDALSGI